MRQRWHWGALALLLVLSTTLAEAQPADNTTKGLWGRVVPIPAGANPRLFWTQAEIDQMRTQLLVYHTPDWLWQRYTSLYQGVLAVAGNVNNPDAYEPWRTNTRAAITYMLEPTQAKADAIRAALLAFPTSWPHPGYDGDWFKSTGYGFSGFPNALMYDLLLAYHPNTMSASEHQSTRDWFKYSSGANNGNFQDHQTDQSQGWTPPTHEGMTVGEYVNSYSHDIWNHLPQAIMSGDQASIDYWADSGWPHDRFTYDGSNAPPDGTNRYDLVMFIRTLFPSGANIDSYGRERFDYAGDLNSWYTNCYNCENNPGTKQDDGSYHYFQFNSVATSAMMAYHNGMSGVFSGFPGQQILGNYLLGVKTRLQTDYRPSSLTGHPDLYTYMSTYMAMRVFSNNTALQDGQQYWHDTSTNSATQADPMAWPFFGQPYGVVGQVGPTTYYVQAGAPDNACPAAVSSTTPVNTITKGIACLHSGDTLQIADGTYHEALPDTVPSGTSSTVVTTIKATNRGNAILQPTTLAAGSAMMPLGTTRSGGVAFVTVDGLQLDGSQLPTGTQATGVAVGATGTSGARSGSHDIRLQHLTLHDFPEHAPCTASTPSVAVQVDQAAYGLTLNDLTVRAIGTGSSGGTCPGVGVAFGGSDSTLQALDITQTQGPGLTLAGLSAGGSNIVRGSFVHTTGAGVLLACGGQSNQLYNTIIAGSGTFGAAPQADSLILGGACGTQTSLTNLVANLTIWNGRGTCVQVSKPGTSQPSNSNVLRNILCWHNDTDQVTVNNGSTGNAIDHNVLGQDPLFVTAPPAVPTDFQVRRGPPISPAIDTGTPVGTATTSDYGGTQRPQPTGGAWDVGAWEAAGPQPTGGQVAHWPFDDGTGTTAADLAGLRPLDFSNTGLTWVTGRVGPSALHCNGTDMAQNATALDLPQWTAMFWWKADMAPTASTYRSPLTDGGSLTAWGFFWSHSTLAYQQAWGMYNATQGWTLLQYPQTPAPLPAQTWLHLAATYDGSTLRAYLNGQPSVNTAAPAPASPGGAFRVCSAGPGLAEAGTIDDLQVWNRALAAQEILQAYTGQGSRRQFRHRVASQ